LIVSNSGIIGVQWETQKCHNRGEIEHLRKVCSKPPNERETGRRGQTGGREGRRGGRGGYQANLTVAKKEEAGVDLTEEDKIFFEILK
jgi:hypothetical protein